MQYIGVQVSIQIIITKIMSYSPKFLNQDFEKHKNYDPRLPIPSQMTTTSCADYNEQQSENNFNSLRNNTFLNQPQPNFCYSQSGRAPLQKFNENSKIEIGKKPTSHLH